MSNNIEDAYTIQCNQYKRTRMLNRTSFDPDACKFQCNLCGLSVKYNNMKSHEKCSKHKVALIDWKKSQPNITIECDVILEIV